MVAWGVIRDRGELSRKKGGVHRCWGNDGGMDDVGVPVRSLVADDLDWVVDLAARCGEQRQSFAPRLWRRVPDARRIHAGYLMSLIEDPDVPAMRTDHVFAFAIRRPGFVLVDDAAAECADRWAGEGRALLRHLVGGSRVRVVCPVPEPQRAALAADLGLSCAESWWHRDLSAGRSRAYRTGGSLQTRGAEGRLVEAPPVYAPGGLVLLVTEFHDRKALAEIERQAASRGAAVSVVTQAPGDVVSEELLPLIGYRRTCEFYEGNTRRVRHAAGVQPT